MSPAAGAAAGAPRSPAALWESRWLWWGLALLSAVPFLVAPLPMQPDWFSHVGRYHVMNESAGDPFLPLYYAFEWRLVGNLGVDLLVRLLGPLFGTERAAILVVGLIPPLGVGGLYALVRAADGRVGPGALAALPLLYAMPFTMGFLNFCLAQALAFWAAAGWLRLAGAAPALRAGFAAAAGALVWIAHIAGWGILLILLACLELGALRRSAFDPRALAQAAIRLSPFALPLIPTLLWRAGGGAASAAIDPWSLEMKGLWLRTLFRDESQALDVATGFLVYLLILILLGQLLFRRAGASAGLLGAGLLLSLLFLLLPHMLLGSYYADMRLLPAALMLLLVAIVPRSPRLSLAVAAAGLALFAARIAVTAAGWHQRATAIERDLAVLDHVPRGSRIAVMASRSLCWGWTPRGFEHVPSLAIVRRHAFVNSQWDQPGANPMRPIYNRGRDFNAVPSNLLGGPDRRCEGRPLSEVLKILPRDRFDFVWLFEWELPAGTNWLTPVAAGPNGRLYRVEARPAAGKASGREGNDEHAGAE